MAKKNGQELSLYKAALLSNLLSEFTQDTLQKVMHGGVSDMLE